LNSLELYHQLITQQIGVAPSALFNVLENNQHAIRLNCSFEWSPSIQTGLDTLIDSILNIQIQS
ncbi:MAG: transcriptional regulator, partial [Gammaproteobacteria bacterium]|nr:transcriptional regulator [Gammaproteobacteria bacterium]